MAAERMLFLWRWNGSDWISEIPHQALVVVLGWGQVQAGKARYSIRWIDIHDPRQ
jgi:hypothetical protein